MATINSNGTGGGASDATATWSGAVVPVEGDKVNILSGDTVTMQATHIWGDDTTTAINLSGIIKASRSASSSLTCKGSFIGNNGGEVDYGKSGDAISSTYTHDLILNYSASMANAKYGFHIKDGCDLYMFGATRTINTTTTSQITAGTASVDVTDVTGWAVGDKVVLATTGSYSSRTQYDVLTIQGIVTNTVTFTGNATYTHLTGCRIGNFSSNITLQPYATTHQTMCWFEHAANSAADTRHVEYVAFDHMGGGSTTIGYSGLFIDGSNRTTDVWSAGLNNCSIYRTTATTSEYTLTIFDNEKQVPFSGLAVFNSANTGFWVGQGAEATFTDCVLYYSNTYGINSSYSEGGVNVEITGCTFIGVGQGFIFGSVNGWTVTNSTFISGRYGCQHLHGAGITYNTCTIGVTGQENDYNFAAPTIQSTPPAVFNDCDFADALTAETYNIMGNVQNDVFSIAVSNKNVDPSLQIVYKGAGALYRDNSIFKTGAASLRLEPALSTRAISFKLDIFAPTSKAVVVSGYLRKNSTYGSSNLPYVQLSGLGITADTSTMTDVDDTWWQFKVSGTQTTGTDGMLTLTVYAQSAGASAQAWVDGIVSATPAAINSGDFGFWALGQPVSAIAANFVSGADVWSVQESEVTLDGSMGTRLKYKRSPN